MSATLAWISWKVPMGLPNWVPFAEVGDHCVEAGLHAAKLLA